MINRLVECERPARSSGDPRPPGTTAGGTVQQRMTSLWGQASRWVVEHPEIALTTAVVTGVVLGWLIKRR